MHRTTPVLALSTILASILFAATQHPADAACNDERSPGCSEPGRPIGPLAENGRRGFDDLRREHDLPVELLDKVRSLAIPQDKMEDLTNQLMDIVHRYGEAQGHVHEAEKKILDADAAIDRAKSERISGEAQKRAGEEERGRQFSRFIFVLEDALRDFRPPPPPREARWEPRWRPHRVFWHHFREYCEPEQSPPRYGCWPERRPEFFPPFIPRHPDPYHPDPYHPDPYRSDP